MKTNQLFSYFQILFISSAYIFLYIPILVLILFSFNSATFPYRWVSFSWHWYAELFQSPIIWHAAKNSLIVAVTSSLLSLSCALSFVFYAKQAHVLKFKSLFYLNVIVPEVILAMGLLLLFTFFAVPTGLTTLVIGHTVLGLGFAIPIIAARFGELDYSLIEASLDLGATLQQTFVRVVIPLLAPALIAAGLLVFIISLDDFLIAFFCSGSSAQTLSLYIFATIRAGISPVINALSTLLLLLSSVVILVLNILQIRTRIF